MTSRALWKERSGGRTTRGRQPPRRPALSARAPPRPSTDCRTVKGDEASDGPSGWLKAQFCDRRRFLVLPPDDDDGVSGRRPSRLRCAQCRHARVRAAAVVVVVVASAAVIGVRYWSTVALGRSFNIVRRECVTTFDKVFPGRFRGRSRRTRARRRPRGASRVAGRPRFIDSATFSSFSFPDAASIPPRSPLLQSAPADET